MHKQLLVTFLVFGACLTSAQEPVLLPGPLISVSGVGMAVMKPEIADVTLGIETQANSAREAQAKASAVAQRILDSVVKLGVDRQAVQTRSVTLESVYSQPTDSTQPPVLVAYRASNTVEIRVRDLGKIGPVIDASIDSGANNVTRVQFGVISDLTAKQEALQDAVREARAKAEAIANALGVQLGELYDVTATSNTNFGDRIARLESRVSDGTPISVGQISISAGVTIRYRIKT